MEDLSAEFGPKDCVVRQTVMGRMKWAGHVIIMKEDRLPKRAVALSKKFAENEDDLSTAKMEGLSEQRSKKGSGGRKKHGETRPTTGSNGKHNKRSRTWV